MVLSTEHGLGRHVHDVRRNGLGIGDEMNDRGVRDAHTTTLPSASYIGCKRSTARVTVTVSCGLWTVGHVSLDTPPARYPAYWSFPANKRITQNVTIRRLFSGVSE